MLAVYVNCLTVILGTILGCVFSKKISSDLSKVISTGAGVVTLVLGIEMALKYQNIIILAFSMILGGILGTWLNIDGAILSFGNFLEKHFYHKKIATVSKDLPQETNQNQAKSSFAYAFLNASVLFCVGAMSIIGSIKAGIEKDYTIIFTKSILDGFLAIVFASSMGIGTGFSSLSILIYQGSLTLLAKLLEPYVTETLLHELSAIGGALIVMIGTNLIGFTKIKTANYLPALVLSVVFVFLIPLITGCNL